MRFIEENGQSTIVSTRTLAMVHGAIHDALNAIDRRYDAYYFEGPADSAASPDAAIAAAAHTVLVGVVNSFGMPAQRGAALALAEQAYAMSIARVTASPARNQGVAAGRAAGAAMLALRKDDGVTRDAPYTPGMGPGKWRPHPNPVPANPPIANPDAARGYLSSVVPGWGNVTPFTLLSASQFWLAGPPALTSATYARDYNEVKNIGGKVSTIRTADQTDIARFWFEGPGFLEHHRAHGGNLAWPRRPGQRPCPGPHEHGNGRRVHRRLQDPLCVRFVAPGDRHPRRGR